MSGHLASVAEHPDRLDLRTNMFIAAVLQCDGVSSPVKVRNMSTQGAMLDTPTQPRVGAKVILLRGSLVVGCDVAWSIEQRCGVRFETAVQVNEWMARPTAPGQARVDAIVAQVKAGVVPLDRGVGQAIGPVLEGAATRDQLAKVSELLKELVEDLAADPAVIAQHGRSLQNLDIALQLIGAMQTPIIG